MTYKQIVIIILIILCFGIVSEMDYTDTVRNYKPCIIDYDRCK